MPQLDLVSFLPQLFWFVIIILILYFQLGKNYLPNMNKTLLFRAYFVDIAKENPLILFAENTSSRFLFRNLTLKKLRIQSESDVNNILMDLDGFKDAIRSKNSRQVRQHQSEQSTWRSSWLSTFLTASNGDAIDSRTKTLAAMNSLSALKLARFMLSLISSNAFVNVKSDDIVTRYYILEALTKLKSLKKKRTLKKKPVTQKPVTEEPVTKKSVTKKPVTKKAVTKKAVTEKPVTKKPVTKK